MRWGTALDWRERVLPLGTGQVGLSFIPKLKLLLSSPSHKAWSTGSANKQWGQQMGQNRTSEPHVGPGAGWRQGMSLLHAVLAMQTKLRGPSPLPSSSVLPWYSHAPGTVGDV